MSFPETLYALSPEPSKNILSQKFPVFVYFSYICIAKQQIGIMKRKFYSAPELSFVDVETSGMLLTQSSIESGGTTTENGQHGEARNVGTGAGETAVQSGIDPQQLDF